MRRRRLPILMFAMFCLATLHASDVTGKWQGSVQTPDGDLQITFDLKAEGDVLTGTVESVMGIAPLKNGTVTGDVLTFDVEVEAMTITHEATVNGDEITIKAKGDWGESEYVVKHVRP